MDPVGIQGVLLLNQFIIICLLILILALIWVILKKDQ